MPRALHPPPFPDTPGKWLAAYRYRGTASGPRPSAEQLSHLMGVSGATIRRWESGQVRPTREDLDRFAEVCELAPLEREFIQRCFTPVSHETPPTPEAYELLMRRALHSALPAMVMDSLFYVRGWNSHIMTISGRETNDLPSPHHVASLFDPRRQLRLDQTKPDQFTPWLRNFWLMTAELCGTEPYTRTLENLRTIADFEERWWELALTKTFTDIPANLPSIYRTPNHGVFRIFVTTVTLPPTYYLREFAPVDSTAHRFIQEWRASGFPIAGRAPNSHWSQD